MKAYDVIVIGAGPAGVSAALTLRNRGKSVGVIANPPQTTNLYKAEHITNYPGIVGSGKELNDVFIKQLEQSGAELISCKALSVLPLGGSFGVSTSDDVFEARAVVAATGISRRPLCEGETKFLGRGVSYCATCDGMLYRGKTVALIGNSREAKEDADFLADIGCRVLRFEENGRYEISGGLKADTLKFRGQEYKVDCVFIIKDTVSVTRLVPGLNYEKGGIVTDRHMATNLPGVFAAGDCTGKPYQLPKAVGEGNIAALSACEYLDSAK